MGPPGRAGPFPAGRKRLAGPDRRGRRSLPTRPRRSRQRPLAGRDTGSRGLTGLDVVSKRGAAWQHHEQKALFSTAPDFAPGPSGLRLLLVERAHVVGVLH
jgi:hypothetical protein